MFMPRARITKSFVDQIPHTEKSQIIYSDTELPGFYLIVGTQTKTYVVQRDMQGKAVRITIGRHGVFTPDEARKIAKQKLYLMATGINPSKIPDEERAQIVSLQEVMDAYLASRKNLKPRTRFDYPDLMKRYLSDWLPIPLAEITKEMISRRHSRIGEENGPYVANKTMRILSAFFNFANATYDICPINPVLYLTRVKAWYKQSRKQRYIKIEDLPAWWSAVHSLQNDTYRDFLLLLLFTGLRRNEAARLEWSNVDLNSKTFMIPDTKNGDPLTLPMSQYVFDLLLRRQKIFSEDKFVFPGSGKEGCLAEPKKGIQKVIDETDIEFSCHDLRRTFITIAESLEVSSYALKKLINHRVTDVTGA